MSRSNSTTTVYYVGIFRRLFAIFYDCLLLLALLFIDAFIFTAINGGQAVERDSLLFPAFVISLLGVSFMYFGWFWTHGGQTLGMKTWQMKLLTEDGRYINWKQAFIRYLTAFFSWCCLAMGFIWSFFNAKKQCWHDISSRSVMLDLRKYR